MLFFVSVFVFVVVFNSAPTVCLGPWPLIFRACCLFGRGVPNSSSWVAAACAARSPLRLLLQHKRGPGVQRQHTA